MKAAIDKARVKLDTRTRLLSVQMKVTNLDRETWSPEEGVTAAAQIRESETGVMIIDGPRSIVSGPVVSGESIEITVAIELPRITGRFDIFVSMLKEKTGWFFDFGSSFFLVEYETLDGQPSITQQKVTTLSSVRIQRSFCTIKKAFAYPFRIFSRHGSLIRSMVLRDLLGRYRGSYAGLFWTVMHPLLMMLTYYFVFGLVLQTRFGEGDNPSNFVLYFLAGMLPWLAISEAVGRAPTTVTEHSNFVKKLMFPVEILPVILVITGLVSEAFGVGVFILGMAVLGYTPTASLLYLPLVLVPQFLLTLGLCWIFAALGVFFRDLGQFIGFALTIWFFTTPICYPEASLPENYRWFFEINPLSILVQSYRFIFLEASPPPLKPLGWLTLGATTVFLLGHGWFYKLKRSFPDII